MKIEKWNRQFITLWSGQAVSILSSAIMQMAIVWSLTDRTNSAAVLSFATLIGFLPQAIIGSFAGVFIDRYDRKKIMIVSDLGIALLSLVLVIVGFFGEIPIWLIMVILCGRSVGAAFHYPSLQAVTPLIVPKEQLIKYAGYSQGFESLSYLISPAVAAMLYGFWNLNIIVGLDVFGAVFGVIMLGFVKVPKVKKSEKQLESGYFKELKQGISIIRKEKGMQNLMLISALYAMIYFPIGTLYPLITLSYFERSFQDSAVVEVVFSAGSLIGSFVLGIIGARIHKVRSIAKSIGVYGLGLVVTGLLAKEYFPIFVVLSALMGASVPFFTGIETTIFQMKFQSEYLGRVLSLVSSITLIAMPLGLLFSGTFAEVMGVEKWFLLSGILTVILAVSCVLIPSLRNCCDEL